MGNEPEGHVWTYEKVTGNCWSSIPEQTAKQTHFYSIEKPDGTMDTTIEEVLSRFEGRAAPVYEALLTGDIPKPSKERAYFSHFVELLVTRTPLERRMHAEVLGRGIQIQNYAYAVNDGAFESLIRGFEKDTGQKLDEAAKASARKSMMDPSGYELILSQEATLSSLKSMETLARDFYGMEWSILRAKHGFFITSDNPVVHRVDPRTWHPLFGDGGFRNPTVEVTFPLSREVLLLMSWNNAPRKEQLGREEVDLMNKVRAVSSDRYLYAHIQHKYVKAFLLNVFPNHPQCLPEPRISEKVRILTYSNCTPFQYSDWGFPTEYHRLNTLFEFS